MSALALPLAGCGGGGTGGGSTGSAYTSTTSTASTTATAGASASTGTSAVTSSAAATVASAAGTPSVSLGTSGSRGYVPVTVQIGANAAPLYMAPDASSNAASFPDTANVPIVLTAPVSYADRQFVKWQWAGQDLATTNTLTTSSAQLTTSGPITAVYQAMPAPAGGFTPNFTRTGFPHWSTFPVTVYLDGTVAAGSSNQASIINGMNRWVSASGGVISYQIVSDPTQADISIGFGSTPTGLAALTSASWDGNMNLLSATIALNPPVVGANQVAIQNLDTIVAHEFGHALGLLSDTDLTAGHSTDPDDTMYPTGNTSIGLITARDMNTMATNYPGSFAGSASGSALGKSMSVLHGRARRAAAVGTIHHAAIL